MIVLRLIITLVLTGFAGYIVVMNWACLIVSVRNRRRGIDKHHSMVPAISLFLVIPAFFFYPFSLKCWIWLIPLVDIANWTTIVSLAWLAILWVRNGASGRS